MTDDHLMPVKINSSAITSTFVKKVASTIWADSPDTANSEARERAITAWLQELNPQDAVEQMIMTQLVLLHNALMNCLQRANSPNSFSNFSEGMNQANKITRSFTALVDSLNRHRGKSSTEQKITVQYVNVANGGQAVVGSIAHPKAGSITKNRE